jgi:hypothetical protein
VTVAFHSVSGKYLPPYIADYQFRYNDRENDDIFDAAISRTAPTQKKASTFWTVVRGLVWFATTLVGLEILEHYVSHFVAWTVALIFLVVFILALVQTRKKINR